MTGTADDDEARKSADRAGDRHRTHNNFLYIDADILRRILALTYDRDLVPLFAVLQVAEHGGSEHQNDQNDPSVSQSGKSRNPAKLCLGVDNPDGVGACRVLPENDTEGDDLHGNVVHH